MEQLLQCSLCQETLKEPRTLGCFHSFCKHCLARYVNIQRGDQPAGRVKSVFHCPLCRSQFELRQGESVERLPSNYFVDNMYEILVLQQQAEKLPCDSCKTQLSAVSKRVDCEKYLCKNCITAHNNWLKDHVVLTLEELAKPENQVKARGKPRCKKQGHGNKPLEFNCNTCHDLACINYVVLDHPKPDHDYQPVDVVATQRKEALKNTSAILQKKSEQGQNALKKIERASQVVKASAKEAKDAIWQQERDLLAEFTAKLKQKTTALLREVDQKYHGINQKLVKQQTEMTSYVKKVNGSLRYAQGMIEKGSNEEIITLGGEIEIKSKQIETECPKLMHPVHIGDFAYEAESTESIFDTVDLNGLGKIVNTPAQLLCETSTILEGNTDHAQQLTHWVKDGQFRWNLCYRASRDGWRALHFHRKCDLVGPTVILIKCLTNVFGGYTDQSWKIRAPWMAQKAYWYKRSNASFLFSLRNKDNLPPFKCPIYDDKKDGAIFCGFWFGASFGGLDGDLLISDNANTNQDSYSNLGHTYQPPPGYQPGTPQTRSLLAGSYKFTPTEIEVFRR